MGRRAAGRATPRHLKSVDAVPAAKPIFGLLLLNTFLPGAVHFMRGKHPARWAFLAVPALIWAGGTYVALSALADRRWFFALLTHPVNSMILIVCLLIISLWYLITYLDLLRLIQLPKLSRGLQIGVIATMVPLLVLTSGSTAYAAYLINVGRVALDDIFTGPGTGNGKTPVKPLLDPVDGRYNILMMGGDAGEYREGRRPDSIMAISVDANTGAIATISIPRNLQNAPFPADSPMKAALTNGDGVDGTDGAFNCGDQCIIGNLYSKVNEKYKDLYPGVGDPGAQAMLETTSAILGIKMQAYVIVDMDNFAHLIDLMGGVTINAGGWVPISGEALDNVGAVHKPPEGWIHPGKQKLNGYQALWYSRSRQWVLDYSRNLRQQCIAQAMVKQMDPLTLFTKFAEIAKAGTQIIESDISTAQIASFIDLALKSQTQPVKRLTIGPPDLVSNVPGQTDFPTYPDFALSKKKVAQLLNPPPPATKKVSPSGSAQPSTSKPSASQPAPSPSTASQQPKPSTSSAPPVTEEYLQQLAVEEYNGNPAAGATLTALLADNGQCTPG